MLFFPLVCYSCHILANIGLLKRLVQDLPSSETGGKGQILVKWLKSAGHSLRNAWCLLMWLAETEISRTKWSEIWKHVFPPGTFLIHFHWQSEQSPVTIWWSAPAKSFGEHSVESHMEHQVESSASGLGCQVRKYIFYSLDISQKLWKSHLSCIPIKSGG